MENFSDGLKKVNANDAEPPKKTYSAPQLTNYGSLTELVKNLPNRGADGGLTGPDCTFT